MRSLLRCLSLLLLFFSGSAVTALANDLEAHLDITCIPPYGSCNYQTGIPDRPVSGDVTFSDTPWS